jgi:hypothetical protein
MNNNFTNLKYQRIKLKKKISVKKEKKRSISPGLTFQTCNSGHKLNVTQPKKTMTLNS